jgi:hypothetical protein
MNAGMWFWISVAAVVLYIFLLKRGIAIGVESRFKAKLKEIEREKAQALAEIEETRALVAQMRAEFDKSHVGGRRWLIGLIGEALEADDDRTVQILVRKSRPAFRAAQEVKRVKQEKRTWAERAKHFEYMLKMLYEEYPILGDYEEDILDDKATLNLGADTSPDADLVSLFVSDEDYRRLSPAQRNQLALERWKSRKKSSVEIGRLYERYIGSVYENNGWRVNFHGATEGLEDLGRDLICEKNNDVHIVQAKYWAQHKTIHEKHVFQLYGTTFLYSRHAGKGRSVRAVLCCTNQVSDVAGEAAQALGVAIRQVPMEKDYPMIKCNVNGKDRIYHLPFDQQYDRVCIGTVPGECYARTTEEAERLGFRRAKRWLGTAAQ